MTPSPGLNPGVRPWRDARTYFQERWGRPVGRVGVDGGFSCPHRSGPEGGCAFCSSQGNRPPYQTGAADLAEQVARGTAFQRERYGIETFSLYFQSYSSTWAPVPELRRIYDYGLSLAPFVDLTVGTRPDCVPNEVVDLLAAYQNPDREVWVELGLQSSRDDTLARIHRGHNVEAFRSACARLRTRGIPFTVHTLFGLPGEGKADFLNTVDLAVAEGASGLKFHDLILVPGTALHRQWELGLLDPVDPEAYLDAVADALIRIPPSTVVWRVASDPEDRKGPRAPGKKEAKNRFLNRLEAEVERRSVLQ